VGDLHQGRRHALQRPAGGNERVLRPIASNRFSAGRNGMPLERAISAIVRAANSGWAFKPRPTAVPPSGSSSRSANVARSRRIPWSTWEAYPENSCPSVTGTASCRCVARSSGRRNSAAFPERASRSAASAGRSRSDSPGASRSGSPTGSRRCSTGTGSRGRSGGPGRSPPAASRAVRSPGSPAPRSRHVRGGSGAGLEDVDHELVVRTSPRELPGGAGDRLRQGGREDPSPR